MNSNDGNAKSWKLLSVVITAIMCSAAFAVGYVISQPKQDSSPEIEANIVLDEFGRIVSMTVVDDYGRTVELDGVPQRIVSASPTPTEILFAVGAGDQIVGVDDFSDYPEEAKNKTKVGSFELNVEVIVALEPDLVICSDLVPEADLTQIEGHGIPYFILATRTLEDVFKDVRLAGVLTGHIQEAEALASSLEARVEAVTEKTLAQGVSKPRVYLEYYPMWTFGPGSYGDDLITLAGGTNIAANTSSEYPELNAEFIIAADPEIIVYTVGPMSVTTAEEIASRPGWDEITAVKEGSIYPIDDNIISRYGPRIVDGLEALALLVHPELYN